MKEAFKRLGAKVTRKVEAMLEARRLHKKHEVYVPDPVEHRSEVKYTQVLTSRKRKALAKKKVDRKARRITRKHGHKGHKQQGRGH